ncbi:MAG: DUF1320 domain-containing protein [Bacteroidales bacterium]|nr:DUF1320 domain-containing protein [Bacteroidales bacterium]
MFCKPEELKTVAYTYQIDQITMEDETIVITAIETAKEEVRSYLSHRYDMQKAFAAEGSGRNPQLLHMVKVIALYHIVQLSNVDMLYDRVKADYDAAIPFLNRCADGKLNPSLPPIVSDDGTTAADYGMEWGSDPKLKNNY